MCRQLQYVTSASNTEVHDEMATTSCLQGRSFDQSQCNPTPIMQRAGPLVAADVSGSAQEIHCRRRDNHQHPIVCRVMFTMPWSPSTSGKGEAAASAAM